MAKKILFVILSIIISSNLTLVFADQITKKEQSGIIQKIISSEKDDSRKQKLADIIDYIDSTYSDIHKHLKDGGKITIYFGPAHGKDHTEQWRGITTNRVGVTGLPEEYYSIIYSRKLYNMLKKNKFLRIVAKPEYQEVLDDKSDSYHYMKFPDVLQAARDANAFMVIEMHMNNVAIFHKADGLVNMPGIHLARDSSGRKMLINIRSTYSGFMTLYNKYDASGFSGQYAVNIRQSLIKKGYTPNGWQYGAVADDRFTYYLNFPVSVIYECGFISDPVEEKKLLNDEYSDGMIKSQYDMLIKTCNDMFGIDISGDELKITEKDFSKNIELLKLARIVIFYIQETETSQANKAINAMKKNFYYGNNKGVIDYYSSMMKRINNSESLYNKGIKYKNKKKHSKARKYFVYAKNNLNSKDLFLSYKKKYNEAIYGNRKKSDREINNSADKKNTLSTASQKITKKERAKELKETSVIVKKSSINKPVILIIRKNQSIEKAVEDALNTDLETTDILAKSLKSYCTYSSKKVNQYSKKKKKNIYVYQKVAKKYEFYEGIYIVNLDKNKRVINVERVSSVYLNPDKYQNQQYLKNSYFAETEKEKDY